MSQIRSRQSSEVSTAEELALLVDAVQDYALFVLSPEGIIRSWNAGAERTFGYTADEAIGRSFTMFYPEEVASTKPDEELRIAATTGRVEDEGWRKRKGGAAFWVNTIITALRDPSGELRGFAKVTRDMSERFGEQGKISPHKRGGFNHSMCAQGPNS